MVSNPTRAKSRKAARETTSFSFLTCLAVTSWLICGQALYDSYIFFEEHRLIPSILGRIWSPVVGAIGLHPVYGFGLPWWIITGGVAFMAAKRLGRFGVVYSVCAVLMLLVLMHNFRGIAMRHNVFEIADIVTEHPARGVAGPLVWDLLFFGAALAGSGLGIVLSRRTRADLQPRTQVSAFSQPAIELAAGACVAAGIVETIITLAIAARSDDYPIYPAMNHGYAVIGFGILTWVVARFKENLFDFEVR